jgi:tetratricopeptide (TPR) repeat protein
MKNYLTLFFALSIVVNPSIGQSFKDRFDVLFSSRNTAGQAELLKDWERADSTDPELYVAYFNYYVNQSRKSMIELGNNPKGKDVFQLMEMDTTKKEPVGYMYESTEYEPILLNKGLESADKGIGINPDRLDIRFGKIFIFGEIENYNAFTTEIIKTIEYSARNNNNWLWEDNKAVDDSKQFMLSSIQDYQLQLYNTNNDELLGNMKQIAEAVLKHYPDHVESLSNLSIVYLIYKEYDKALEKLLLAEKFAPSDYIVLSNIAQAYKLKGDKANAIRYYKLTLKYGDEDTKSYAREQIEELK